MAAKNFGLLRPGRPSIKPFHFRGSSSVDRARRSQRRGRRFDPDLLHHPSPSGARTKDALRSLGEAGHFTPATHPEWLRMAGQFLSGAERNLPRRSLGVGGPFTPDGGLGLPPLPGLRRTRRMGAGFPTETDSVAASPRPTGAISGGAANRRPGWRPRPAGLCRPPGSPTPASSASRRRQERWRGRPRSAPAPCCR